MSEFKLPHVEDLTTNSKLPGQLTENFKAIEQALSDEVTARQSADDDLEKRIKKLEDNSATHDEVKQASQEWNKRTSHIARGTDIATTRAVVMQILASIGQVDLSKLSDADEKIVTKDEFDAFVNKVKGKINLDN